MSDWHQSIQRIVLDAGGADETLILDWGDEVEPFGIPWRQQVQEVRFIEADFAAYYPRGGVSRQIVIRRRVHFETFAALHAAEIDATLILPIRKILQMDLRVADDPIPSPTPAIDSVDEGTATHSHYQAAAAALESVSAEPMLAARDLVITYSIKLGELTKIS